MTTKLEQAARQVVDAWDLGEFSTRMDEAITDLREALAEQAEQEPVAYIYKESSPETGEFVFAEQAEQEPVCIDWDTKTDEPIMGYAAPVRTKDLTDDEIATVYEQDEHHHGEFNYQFDPVSFARAVIAADREKNK